MPEQSAALKTLASIMANFFLEWHEIKLRNDLKAKELLSTILVSYASLNTNPRLKDPEPPKASRQVLFFRLINQENRIILCLDGMDLRVGRFGIGGLLVCELVLNLIIRNGRG